MKVKPDMAQDIDSTFRPNDPERIDEYLESGLEFQDSGGIELPNLLFWFAAATAIFGAVAAFHWLTGVV